MITHYGLFWSEADVFWGRQKNSGKFLGRPKNPIGRRGAPTNLERAKAKDFSHFKGIYALYNDYQLVYVGQAGIGNEHSLIQRIRHHRKDHLANRWHHFCWFGLDDIPKTVRCEMALNQLEAVCIALTNPGLNKQSGAFGDAEQVYQVPHPEADGDLETKLARLLQQEEVPIKAKKAASKK